MRTRWSSPGFIAWLVLLALGLALPAGAQDFRGSILGVVTDSQGGVLPGVSVTVTNLGTNVSSTFTTDSRGQFRVPFLNSGSYSVSAELQGFKKSVRKPIEVRVGDALAVDVVLEPGGIEEVVQVTAETPLLNTTTGVSGQVIDSNQIQQLPLGDGTAYMLSRLAPGVMDSSDLHFSRPMDNGNLAGITVNGALGGNDFTLDGSPNRVSPNNTSPGNNAGVVGFSPPSDAIAEFKVQTNAFDAQAGQTAGGVVNLALKSGTNDFHGAVAYFNRDSSRTSTPLLTERAGGEKPTRTYNRVTATVSGPIIKEKTFFMASFEHLRDVQPEPATYTVPTMLMRQGNMSEFSTLVYDPLTSTGSNNQRTPFAGNIIPVSRINPVALAYLSYYPEPNQPGTEDNYFTNQLRPYDYNSYLGRIDHNFDSRNKLFVSGYYNKRQEDRYNWAKGASNATGEGSINDFLVTQGFDNRSNTGVNAGYTSTLSSSMVFDVHAGWSRFGEWRNPAQDFDPATLGFAQASLAAMGDYRYLPFFTFGGFSTTNYNSRIASLGAQRSDWNMGLNRPFYNISVSPTLTWLKGEHSLRAGYEMRYRRWNIAATDYGAGRYYFEGSYTRANNSAPTGNLAQEWAQFLLGLPTTATNTVGNASSNSSQFETAAPGDYRQVSHGVFIQDDWRVNRKLTVNLGFRLEIERAMTEAENRNLSGFDTTSPNPISAAALAAYAQHPIPEIPVNQFAVNGGVQFADGPIYNTLVKPLPRGSIEYLLDDRTVVRAGVGLFSYPYYFDAGNQSGFSQPTGVITTLNNGGTFLTDLTNPLPSGTLIAPPGSSLGLATSLGLNVGTVVPSERKTPYYTRFQVGIQRDLGAGWVVELTYLGSRGRDLPVTREMNGVPFQYLSTSPTRDAANDSYLTGQVPNPFAGLMPGTSNNGSTIQRQQLLRPYPEFISIVTEEYKGSDRYDAGTILIQKRFTNGNSLVASYTRSRTRDKLNYLNPANSILEDRVSPNDRPNRISAGATFRFPFGKGRRWGGDWSGAKEAILGGWHLSGTYQYQTGYPLTWGTSLYYDPSRNPLDLQSHIGETVTCPNGQKGIAGLDCPAWDTSGFYIPGSTTGRNDPNIVLSSNTVRYFPSTLPNVRTHDLHLMDIGLYKDFSLSHRMKLQIRIEAINALNYTVLWTPNQDPRNASFGIVSADRNNPRDLQLGARLTF
jgi:Carboxypeptidase regulatory-like domain